MFKAPNPRPESYNAVPEEIKPFHALVVGQIETLIKTGLLDEEKTDLLIRSVADHFKSFKIQNNVEEPKTIDLAVPQHTVSVESASSAASSSGSKNDEAIKAITKRLFLNQVDVLVEFGVLSESQRNKKVSKALRRLYKEMQGSSDTVALQVLRELYQEMTQQDIAQSRSCTLPEKNKSNPTVG